MSQSPDHKESARLWSEIRDEADDRVREFVRKWMKWGETRPIPLSLKDDHLKCYKCGKVATHVSWRYVYYCLPHVMAYNKKRSKSFGWRGKVQRQEKLLRDMLSDIR